MTERVPEGGPEGKNGRAIATGYEPWSVVAFSLVGLTALLFVYLGLRPGGRGPVWAYREGTLLLAQCHQRVGTEEAFGQVVRMELEVLLDGA